MGFIKQQTELGGAPSTKAERLDVALQSPSAGITAGGKITPRIYGDIIVLKKYSKIV